jgi:hypothetical protein
MEVERTLAMPRRNLYQGAAPQKNGRGAIVALNLIVDDGNRRSSAQSGTATTWKPRECHRAETKATDQARQSHYSVESDRHADFSCRASLRWESELLRRSARFCEILQPESSQFSHDRLIRVYSPPLKSFPCLLSIIQRFPDESILI